MQDIVHTSGHAGVFREGLFCVSMVCVTPPVEVSPKEARHTAMQTRAFWNDIDYQKTYFDTHMRKKTLL